MIANAVSENSEDSSASSSIYEKTQHCASMSTKQLPDPGTSSAAARAPPKLASASPCRPVTSIARKFCSATGYATSAATSKSIFLWSPFCDGFEKLFHTKESKYDLKEQHLF
jgi:hypothetical protein